MAFARAELNTAVSAKLKDIDQASTVHRVLFSTTQLSGLVCAAGAVLVAPLALEVGAISGVGGLIFYGLSQLIQTKRTGHFLPLPGVPVSAAQLGYVPSRILADVMGSGAPEAPAPVRLLPVDFLPEKERRVNYLLTHCAERLIDVAEQAQDGISFAAIVDTAVRASEFAITDEQIQNPVTGNKMATQVRALLAGDTAWLEEQQRQAITQQYELAKADYAAGVLDAADLATIKGQVEAIAPGALAAVPFALESSTLVEKATQFGVIEVPAQNVNDQGERYDWQEVFALIKDQNEYPAIAIIGAQGTGKTTLINYLLSILNRSKVVLDPHYKAGTWPGCRVIGAGMNYSAIGEALQNISADVAERYAQRACDPNYLPQPVVLVLEEQTNWGKKVPGAGAFVAKTLSDIRKVGWQTISVAHAETNTARGGAVGTAKMRKKGELLIVLEEKGLAKVSLKGRETFMLRFPDPTPYTVETGQPSIADDGNLGPAFCTAGVDGWGQEPAPARQTAIDVQALKVASSPIPQPKGRWDKFREHSSEYPHLVHLSTLLEGKAGETVTTRQLGKNKKASELHKKAQTTLDNSLALFIHYGFIKKVEVNTYQVCRS